MGGINVKRWIAGGVVAGLLVWVFEGVGSVFYMSQMEDALAAHNMSMEMSAGIWVLTILVSLIVGLTIVFFYAVGRSRFGPGPKTAVIVAVMLWFGGTLVYLIGYHMVGMYPVHLLIHWGLIGLIEMIVAALVGGWIYREG
jgi:hypothetical protein